MPPSKRPCCPGAGPTCKTTIVVTATTFTLFKPTSFVVAANGRQLCILASNRVNVVAVTTILVLHVGVIGHRVLRQSCFMFLRVPPREGGGFGWPPGPPTPELKSWRDGGKTLIWQPKQNRHSHIHISMFCTGKMLAGFGILLGLQISPSMEGPSTPQAFCSSGGVSPLDFAVNCIEHTIIISSYCAILNFIY